MSVCCRNPSRQWFLKADKDTNSLIQPAAAQISAEKRTQMNLKPHQNKWTYLKRTSWNKNLCPFLANPDILLSTTLSSSSWGIPRCSQARCEKMNPSRVLWDSSTHGRDSSLRTMASDLEELSFIPAAWLQTTSVCTEDHDLKKPTEQQQLQRAEIQPIGPQTRHPPPIQGWVYSSCFGYTGTKYPAFSFYGTHHRNSKISSSQCFWDSLPTVLGTKLSEGWTATVGNPKLTRV